MKVVRRGAVAIVNAVVILAVVALPPWALIHFAGNPFPHARNEVAHLGVEPLTLQRLAPFLTIFLWVVWLLLLSSVAIEAHARVRGITPARWIVLRPVQGLAAALVAGQAATILAPAATAVAVPYLDPPADRVVSAAWPAQDSPRTAPRYGAHASAAEQAPTSTATVTSAHAVAAVSMQADARHGPATILVGDTSYTYIVKRGDWMSKIAKAWLGDADRWPEICELNRHRHFPKVGGTLRDCNIIYPG